MSEPPLSNDHAHLHMAAARATIYANPEGDIDGVDHDKRIEHAEHAQALALVEIAEHLSHIRKTQSEQLGRMAEHLYYIRKAVEGIRDDHLEA